MIRPRARPPIAWVRPSRSRPSRSRPVQVRDSFDNSGAVGGSSPSAGGPVALGVAEDIGVVGAGSRQAPSLSATVVSAPAPAPASLRRATLVTELLLDTLVLARTGPTTWWRRRTGRLGPGMASTPNSSRDLINLSRYAPSLPTLPVAPAAWRHGPAGAAGLAHGLAGVLDV